ncbi:Grainyhead-like protein 2 like [Verticillium longisporum]|nr:Grainyhead-like protein 2 like [Verticillium longisporum]
MKLTSVEENCRPLIIWTPGANGGPECNIAVRFNFLSTDFSHSKGVKGIPVRLCAKTDLLPADSAQPAPDATPEICFCKVKLFRDHGAERKLSNDVAHVKKTIDKLKQQIAQAESGLKDFGKRKRSSAVHIKSTGPERPGKVQKHKRTWSMSSASSAGGGGGRPPVEEELHFKLQSLQDMFTSTRPVSVLYLRGEDLDDPDAHPVSLPQDSADLIKVESRDSAQWQMRSGRSSVAGSSMVSPSPSSLSLASQASVVPNRQWSGFDSEGTGSGSRQDSNQPTRVAKTDDTGGLSGWIEALGVDPSYRPPPERVTKPVACFYVAQKKPTGTERRELHKAIYLGQRTLKDFNFRVASKWNLQPSRVLRTIHVLQQGLEVEIDDDVIQELKEGQDMTLEVVEIGPEAAVQVKREWEMAVDQNENDTAASEAFPAYLRQTQHGAGSTTGLLLGNIRRSGGRHIPSCNEPFAFLDPDFWTPLFHVFIPFVLRSNPFFDFLLNMMGNWAETHGQTRRGCGRLVVRYIFTFVSLALGAVYPERARENNMRFIESKSMRLPSNV